MFIADWIDRINGFVGRLVSYAIWIGMTTGLSLGRLFVGGLIAGGLVLVMMMADVAIRSWRTPSLAPALGRAGWLKSSARCGRW